MGKAGGGGLREKKDGRMEKAVAAMTEPVSKTKENFDIFVNFFFFVIFIGHISVYISLFRYSWLFYFCFLAVKGEVWHVVVVGWFT